MSEIHHTKQIAIFASGSGSNAENIYDYFQDSNIHVKYLVCNHATAGVLTRFEKKELEILLVSKTDLKSEEFIQKLKDIDLIVLAGFLLLIPPNLIQSFPDKIINIHPALLPKYGGKGMYGDHVHRAILGNKEEFHGITIHYVNEEFDKGEIIFQEKFKVTEDDSLTSIQTKIHQLEFEWFPKIIEKLLNQLSP